MGTAAAELRPLVPPPGGTLGPERQAGPAASEAGPVALAGWTTSPGGVMLQAGRRTPGPEVSWASPPNSGLQCNARPSTRPHWACRFPAAAWGCGWAAGTGDRWGRCSWGRWGCGGAAGMGLGGNVPLRGQVRLCLQPQSPASRAQGAEGPPPALPLTSTSWGPLPSGPQGH